MEKATNNDERIANMSFSLVYPLYLAKIKKKGRTLDELNHIIEWLTGYTTKEIQKLIKERVTFEKFFQNATLNSHAYLITGVICGCRVENIQNPLTQKIRYLDKLIDELARGKSIEKILRKSPKN